MSHVLDSLFAIHLQFLMFYACSLDPENCGVKFAVKLMDIGIYCFQSQALPDTILYTNHLLRSCSVNTGDHVCALLPDDIHPSCSFIFDKLLESELSRGSKKLDAFFPFDPCLLRSSNRFVTLSMIFFFFARSCNLKWWFHALG